MASRRLKTALAAAMLGAGLLQLGQGAYIHAKAALAQALLERAWDRASSGETRARPWAWADTWPAARLRIPARGIDQVVLEGGSGNVLAFAPGRLRGSAEAGGRGRIVISGHRDTHFRFLEQVAPGERLWLQSPGGAERSYRVSGTRIVDIREQNGDLLYSPADGLTLITCFPFGALRPGGPLRYLVDADPVSPRLDARLAQIN